VHSGLGSGLALLLAPAGPCWEWTSDKFETTGKGVVLVSSFATLGLVISLLATLGLAVSLAMLGLTVSLAKLGLIVSLAKLGLVVSLAVSSRCSFFLSFFFIAVSRLLGDSSFS
jgi:hypothetical protein